MTDSHKIFTKFTLWEGRVPARFDATVYGSFVRRSFENKPDYEHDNIHVKDLPQNDEDIFELIDVLESIDSAKESFTMVELGAGYGRWSVIAAVVLRNHKNIPYKLIVVEPEHNHYQMIFEHFVDNGLNPKEHTIIEAAVTETDGPIYFPQGYSKNWWGQSIIPSKDYNFGNWPEATVEEIPGYSINTILKEVNYVDFMDMDIQGTEVKAVRGSLSTLNDKVRRIHIGTHSQENEKDLYDIFSKEGWICCNNFTNNSTVDTEYGPISFQDGVQTWINPSL